MPDSSHGGGEAPIESTRIARLGPIGGALMGVLWIILEVAFISNLGPAVAIVPVFLLPVASILFALGLRNVLGKVSTTFAAVGASFLVAAHVGLLVGGMAASSLPGGFLTVTIIAVGLLSIGLVILGFVQRKAPEFPKWSAYLAFATVVGFWTLSPMMSTTPIGLVAFAGRLVLFMAWIFTTTAFLWRAARGANSVSGA